MTKQYYSKPQTQEFEWMMQSFPTSCLFENQNYQNMSLTEEGMSCIDHRALLKTNVLNLILTKHFMTWEQIWLISRYAIWHLAPFSTDSPKLASLLQSFLTNVQMAAFASFAGTKSKTTSFRSIFLLNRHHSPSHIKLFKPSCKHLTTHTHTSIGPQDQFILNNLYIS